MVPRLAPGLNLLSGSSPSALGTQRPGSGWVEGTLSPPPLPEEPQRLGGHEGSPGSPLHQLLLTMEKAGLLQQPGRSHHHLHRAESSVPLSSGS